MMPPFKSLENILILHFKDHNGTHRIVISVHATCSNGILGYPRTQAVMAIICNVATSLFISQEY